MVKFITVKVPIQTLQRGSYLGNGAATLQLTAAALRLSLLFSPFSGVILQQKRNSKISKFLKEAADRDVGNIGVTLLQQKRSSKISKFLKEAADRDVGNIGFPSQCYYSLDPASLAVTSDDANTHKDPR